MASRRLFGRVTTAALLLLAWACSSVPVQSWVPTTGSAGMDPAAATALLPASSLIPLDSFVQAVKTGRNDLAGVYAADVMAYRVVQQPVGKDNFVSSVQGVVTQFRSAEKYGTVGLLAHNYAAGKAFFDLQPGSRISLIYGDGSMRTYQVRTITSFQALEPNSPSSDYVDLGNGQQLSASSLFQSMYTGDQALVLQTCIARDGLSSWGRMFIQAELVP